MGDGINDAAALRDADAGISVDAAVDIAKKSADIILPERDFPAYVAGTDPGAKPALQYLTGILGKLILQDTTG